MKLLDLPQELFEPIIGFLVGEVRPLHVAEYRLVCKLFAYEIQEQILTKQPLVAYSDAERDLPGPEEVHMAIAIDNARFEKLFAQYGGTIIGHEVLRRQKNPLPVIQYLRELTESVINLEGPATDESRKQYTIDICTAMSSVYWKQLRWRIFLRDSSEVRAPSIADDLPAALAATGKVQLLLDQEYITADRLLASCSCLPNLVQAAAACGKLPVLRVAFECIARKVEDDSEYPRLARHHLESALVAAIRTNRKQSAYLIVEFIHSGLMGSLRTYHIIVHCMRHRDVGLMRTLLDIRAQSPQFAHLTLDTNDGENRKVTTDELHKLLSKGSCSVLRALLQDGLMSPNYIDADTSIDEYPHRLYLYGLDLSCDTTPLTLAIHNHRYDLARVLLQNGAHIDGVPKSGKPLTALWHATKTGFTGYGAKRFPGIRFLLEHGADPDIHGDWRSPLQLAENMWPDVYFLLRQAKDFGNDVAFDPDTWERFERMQQEKTVVVID